MQPGDIVTIKNYHGFCRPDSRWLILEIKGEIAIIELISNDGRLANDGLISHLNVSHYSIDRLQICKE